MPSVHTNEGAENAARLCKRCGLHPAAIQARQDLLCQECYTKFVNTKIIKRMEAFRVRNAAPSAQRRVLLPASGGISSTTLLHVLSSHIESQLSRTGRAGYELHVLHVLPVTAAANNDASIPFMERLKERYPRHSYHVTPFLSAESTSDTQSSDPQQPSPIDLTAFLPTLPTPTSRADITTIALTRTITTSAHNLACEAILWGTTTTRLAERVLSLTAQGRGSALPWLVNDTDTSTSDSTTNNSPHSLPSQYPMRDLLKKELPPYAALVSLPLHNDDDDNEEVGTAGATASMKDTSIDALMTAYVASVEKEYPSIVANVVRTAGKLQAPAEEEAAKACGLCGLPVAEGGFGIEGWGGYRRVGEGVVVREGDGAIAGEGHEERGGFCYGCARATLGAGLNTR